MSDEMPTIGQMIRALRMGFGWFEPALAFIRISGDGPFLFEFHPPGLIPNKWRGRGAHTAWWPGSGRPGINLNDSQFVRSLKRVKRAFAVHLDDDGKITTP